jgi:serine/threonine protein kinase
VLTRGERPDRATLIDWGTQILEILAEAHAEGILYRHLTEDDVFLTPEGRLLLADRGSPGPLPGEPYTAQNDLYAAGCLLRRLAFASLHGGRDPLVKVLARATFPGPGARYESAAEMAAALREAGQVEGGTGPRRLEPRPGAGARVARFPGVVPSRRPSRPPDPSPERAPAEADADSALWHALVLLVMSLLLMAFLLVTGAVMIHRDTSPWRNGGLTPPLAAPLVPR